MVRRRRKRVAGKTYGVVDGWQKVLISSDPKVLQDVFVNKFDHFHARRVCYYFSIITEADGSQAFFFFIARTGRKAPKLVLANVFAFVLWRE